jgi:hypothetical protein
MKMPVHADTCWEMPNSIRDHVGNADKVVEIFRKGQIKVVISWDSILAVSLNYLVGLEMMKNQPEHFLPDSKVVRQSLRKSCKCRFPCSKTVRGHYLRQ